MLIIITSLLTALSVSLTGIIGFVGLIVPYTIRMFFGSNHSKLIPLSYFFGGIFLLLIDDISRAFFQPEEIKLGVLTSLIGAPFFLIMLFRSKNKSFI